RRLEALARGGRGADGARLNSGVRAETFAGSVLAEAPALPKGVKAHPRSHCREEEEDLPPAHEGVDDGRTGAEAEQPPTHAEDRRAREKLPVDPPHRRQVEGRREQRSRPAADRGKERGEDADSAAHHPEEA